MFHFKRFSVDDALCAMKVGTDGVLLGTWADVSGAQRILDAGCGSGLIALMVAQRNEDARLTAIDIDRGAVEQSRVNVEASPWAERIEVLLADLRNFSQEESYDHIVTNPPFFNDSLSSPDEQRAVARHSLTLSYDDIVVASQRLLRPGGRLSLVLPTAEAALFRRVAFGRMWLRRQLNVSSRRGEAPKRVLMEFELSAEPLMPKVDELAIYLGDDSYEEKYQRLTEDYYLKF
jgi:tRNA1Val (adenine37-N6)-methyltransferase